jgi:hypothetical protein
LIKVCPGTTRFQTRRVPPQRVSSPASITNCVPVMWRARSLAR